MEILGPIFGTPKDHGEEKKTNEVVTAPEFDITQYAKKLGIIIGPLVAAVLGALKAADIVNSDAIVVAAIGLAAVALFGICLISSVDLAARAYLTASGATANETADSPDSDIVPAPRGMLAWLEDGDDPYPVLAISGDGAKASSYLVASGGSVQRQQGDKDVTAIDGAPKWLSADKIRAVRPAKWE